MQYAHSLGLRDSSMQLKVLLHGEIHKIKNLSFQSKPSICFSFNFQVYTFQRKKWSRPQQQNRTSNKTNSLNGDHILDQCNIQTHLIFSVLRDICWMKKMVRIKDVYASNVLYKMYHFLTYIPYISMKYRNVHCINILMYTCRKTSKNLQIYILKKDNAENMHQT